MNRSRKPFSCTEAMLKFISAVWPAIGRAAAIVCVAAVALLQPVAVAEAGIVDRVKDMYQLPGQVETMQKEFDAAKRQLEDQKDKLSESARQSKEAIDTLVDQNKQLQEQNAVLQSRIQLMEQEAAVKNDRSKQMTKLVITAALLIAGYFVLGRLIRLIVWRRHNKSLKQ